MARPNNHNGGRPKVNIDWKETRDLLRSWLGTQPAKGQEIAQFACAAPNSYAAELENELLGTGLIEIINEGKSLRVKPSLEGEANRIAKQAVREDA